MHRQNGNKPCCRRAPAMFPFKPEPIAIPAAPPPREIEALWPPSSSDAAPSACGAPPEIQPEHLQAAAAAARRATRARLPHRARPAAGQVLHLIGHGSSGVVQKVLHTPSDSVLALKVCDARAARPRCRRRERAARRAGDPRRGRRGRAPVDPPRAQDAPRVHAPRDRLLLRRLLPRGRRAPAAASSHRPLPALPHHHHPSLGRLRPPLRVGRRYTSPSSTWTPRCSS